MPSPSSVAQTGRSSGGCRAGACRFEQHARRRACRAAISFSTLLERDGRRWAVSSACMPSRGGSGRRARDGASVASPTRRARSPTVENDACRVPRLGGLSRHRREPERAAGASASCATPTSPPIASASCRVRRQAQPGAAVAARGRGVGLLEGAEDGGLARDGDARRRCPRPRSARAGDAPRAPAVRRARRSGRARRELHRVGEQVDEHLRAAACRRPACAAAGRRCRCVSASPLACALARTMSTARVEHRLDRELGALQHELAGLDLRQVEDVVDDAAADGARHRRSCRAGRAAGCRAHRARAGG